MEKCSVHDQLASDVKEIKSYTAAALDRLNSIDEKLYVERGNVAGNTARIATVLKLIAFVTAIGGVIGTAGVIIIKML